MKKSVAWFFALLTALGTAFAGEPSLLSSKTIEQPPAEQSDGWWFRLAPYAWLTAFDGDVTLRGIEAPIEVSISDTLDTLDFAAMGVVEVGYNRWGIGADVIYSEFADTEPLGGVLFNSVRVKYKQWLVTPRITYRAIDTESYRMDVFAGARYSSIDLGIELRGALLADRELNGSDDWWDPVVGLRGRAAFGTNWFLHYSGLIGGFGTSSDFIWDALLAVGYDVTQNFSVAVGYRGLGLDYSTGEEAVDIIAHGPVLGVGIRF